MKRKFGLMAVAGSLLAAMSSIGLANAQQPAYQTAFTTSITYQNVGSGQAAVSLQFFPRGAGSDKAITISRPALAQNAGTSVFIGSLSEIGAGFTGSAVMSSDQPIVATMVQVPQSTTVKNRPLANGFSAGSSKYLIATVLKSKFNSTTKFSVQNVDSEPVKVTVQFYNADAGGALTHTAEVPSLPAGSSEYFDAGAIGQLPAGFNGSATITAVKVSNNAVAGNVVAAAMELSINGTGASSFEGVSGGGNTFYMASALCRAFPNPSGSQSSAYAVQNTGDDGNAPAVVTVTYSSGVSEQKTVPAGAKASFLGCGDNGSLNATGFSGSATLTSTGNKIVAIGKVTGGGLSTAFLGAANGAPKLATPYIRFATDADYNAGNARGQRSFMAIQNVGGALPANAVRVRYLDKDGREVGVHQLPAIPSSGKVNSTPLNIGAAGNGFGFYADGTFGGSAIIEVDPASAGSAQLVVVVRVQSRVGNTVVAEDYNGVAIQ